MEANRERLKEIYDEGYWDGVADRWGTPNSLKYKGEEIIHYHKGFYKGLSDSYIRRR